MVAAYSKDYPIRERGANFAHPSPPLTPKAKFEWEDTVRLDLVPVRGAADRKYSQSLESPPFVKLPGVEHLPNPHGEIQSTYRPFGLPQRWLSPSSSPEPYAKEEEVYYTGSQIPLHEEDTITRSLNALRMQSHGSNTLPPLPALPGPGMSSSLPSATNLLRPRERRHKYRHGSSHSQRQMSSPPKGVKKRVTRRRKEDGHCNVKYVTEELDFIRYRRVDCGTKWQELAGLFCLQFPYPELPRTRPGIQGGYYRQNDGQIPEVANHGQALTYLPNGHVKPSHIGVRGQHDKKLFGLVALFPERAMNYPWVDSDTRQMATELGKPRYPPATRTLAYLFSFVNIHRSCNTFGPEGTSEAFGYHARNLG